MEITDEQLTKLVAFCVGNVDAALTLENPRIRHLLFRAAQVVNSLMREILEQEEAGNAAATDLKDLMDTHRNLRGTPK